MSAVVTFAQARERAERWINADVPGYQRRDVRIREFDLGFVAWAEDREDVPAADGGRSRLVIARDGGEVTLWPGVPVEEVIRRYEEEYGSAAGQSATPAPPPQRTDLEATSFLLTPPEWLQEAADRMGVPDRRTPADQPAATAGGAQAGAPGGADAGAPGGTEAGAAASPWDAADTSSSGAGLAQQPPLTVFAPPLSGSDEDDTPPPPAGGDETPTAFLTERSSLAESATAPAVDGPGTTAGHPPAADAPPSDTSGSGPSEAGPTAADTPPAGRAVPDRPGTPPPPPPSPPAAPPAAPPGPGARRGGGPSVPPPPGPPPAPGTSGTGGPDGPGGGGYVPTQLVSADDIAAQGGPGTTADQDTQDGRSASPNRDSSPGDGHADAQSDSPGGGSGELHHAATMLAGPAPGGPGTPPPPRPPGAPAPPQPPPAPSGTATPPGPAGPPGNGGASAGPGMHGAATMLAGPAQGAPGAPPPPGAPPGPATPPGPPPAAPQGAGTPPAYGFPQQSGGAPVPPPGTPTVGPGYMAVLRYRAADGSEQQLIRRSAPGTPHPEWQILHELRALNVPPQQVLELHTELESCDLPGGYCARMIRENWPQVRVSHTAAYGTDHASRRQGMRHLVAHQGELHQVADAPPRPAPHRVPLPPQHQIQLAPPIPPDAIGHELAQAFGPQGVFRFDQRAVSRQGVPDIVGQVLVWAGVPVDVTPFFWGQAQPGRPVPTLAELARERGVQPASDADSYLVMGNDFGRQLCVQYGTAHIVAVPLEARPDGHPTAPQFVNTGLPEFIRCLGLLGRMWRLRYGLTPEQAGRWTVDFQLQLAMLDPAALATPENWWSVLLEQMWDGLL